MRSMDFYETCHLFVAAIRVLEYQRQSIPTLDDICQALGFSAEKGHLVCRKLRDLGVVEAVEGAYGMRVSVKDHLPLEEIPRGEEESKIEQEIKKFQDGQKHLSQKIESFQAQQKEKKKKLFEQLQKQLKKDGGDG